MEKFTEILIYHNKSSVGGNINSSQNSYTRSPTISPSESPTLISVKGENFIDEKNDSNCSERYGRWGRNISRVEFLQHREYSQIFNERN